MSNKKNEINSNIFFHINIEFGRCGEKHGGWTFLKCRKEVTKLNECLVKW